MRHLNAAFLAMLFGVVAAAMLLQRCPIARADAPHGSDAAVVAPGEAMQRLHEGNDRFVSQKLAGDHGKDAARRTEVAKGQHPFAIVLGCADSRVPPEVVFDQGLGDLFVIRVAGEVAPPEVVGSVEYAVDHLGCRTIIVLGHARCGAVEAALNAAPGALPEGNLGELLKDIEPAIEKIDRKAPDALDAAVRANAKAVAQTLIARSKMLGEMSNKGDTVVTPAYYDLDSGHVEFMQPIGGGAQRSGHQ